MAEVSNQTMQEPAPYKVYGTNEPYNGMTVEVGGFLYSTVGGALEGDSMQLVANPQPTPPPPPNQNGNQTLGGAGLTTNPNQQQQNQLMGGAGLAGNPNQMQQNQLMGGTQGTSGAGAVNPSNQTGGSGGSY
tara:strand:- start:198 stop:593 length:396 start_codon:yes stop_codon:yes gene_type:complete